MKNEVICSAVHKFCAPLYIFDLDAFAARFRFFKEAFGEEIQINYCMKTNPFLTQASLDYTDRIEVCSYGEFLICKELRIEPKRLLISGVLKKYEDMEDIMNYCGSEAIYTAESVSQWNIINELAMGRGLRVNVYMRLNCGQFGMDEDTILSLLKNETHSGICFYGIHYFTGTQKMNLKKHEKEIARLDALFRRIQAETGQKVEHLEYGTGFGVAYFTDQEEPFTRDVLLQFHRLLLQMEWKGEISLEMGRALAYDCGYYVTRVRDLKTTEGKNICICDGGIHQTNYDGQLRGMYQPYTRVLHRNIGAQRENQTYTVYGSLCTTNDVLMTNFECEELELGDLLVFERVGAYSLYEGMSLFLSHELPGVCLYSEKDYLLPVRIQQETYRLNTICF